MTLSVLCKLYGILCKPWRAQQRYIGVNLRALLQPHGWTDDERSDRSKEYKSLIKLNREQ